MTTTRLVLLRHGQTDWNRTRRIQGQSQSRLDEVGRGQADAAAAVLAGVAPVALWVSDADRARETAGFVSDATGLTPRFDARLREYFFGRREGMLHHEFEAEDPVEYASFRRGDWDAVTGVEKRSDVAARMSAVLGDLTDAVDAAGGGVGLAVSHGAAIRTATADLLGWTEQQAEALSGLDNCGWVVVARGPDRGWRLVAYNRVATG